MSGDVSVAAGVQAVMDLVLKVSIVTAGSAGHALRLSSAHGCIPLPVTCGSGREL